MELFDLHCDTLGRGLDQGASIRRHKGAVDLQRGRIFSPWVQAFAAFLPDGLCPTAAWQRCRGLLDTAVRWEGEEPQSFRIVRCLEELAHPMDGCSALLTVENGGVLGDDLRRIEDLVLCHVRLVGLTWNGDNPWGSGCFGTPDGGLTRTGQQAVRKLEGLRIPIDVSHLNVAGFWQLTRISTAPFIASHSNAAAVQPHPRNLSDDQFAAIRDRGGIVGLNVYPAHLGGHTPAHFRRHLEHFLSLGGEDTVCIGSDLDGFDLTVSHRGVCCLADIYRYLLDEGYPSALLRKIFYDNARRFFQRTIISEKS